MLCCDPPGMPVGRFRIAELRTRARADEDAGAEDADWLFDEDTMLAA